MTANAVLEAERDVIGSCLILAGAVESTSRIITPADFVSPNAAASFTAALTLHSTGRPVDIRTVLTELVRTEATWPDAGKDLLEWQSRVPSPANATAYAAIVVRAATKRSLQRIGSELANSAADPAGPDPGELVDRLTSELARLDSPALGASPGDVTVDELLAEPEESQPPPVVPGLLNIDDRAVMVASEGVGKSEVARQMVMCIGWGIHPFEFSPIDAAPTLLVDLENPRSLVRRRLRYLAGLCEQTATGPRASCHLWHRPGGIDLRKRADRLAFEDVLRRRRPVFVSLGPVYKCYTRRSTESDEQVASEVQAVLDDLRTRYGFALLLEHHAPQYGAGAVRDLRPFGSSLWLRWPEFGLKLKKAGDEEKNLELDRWRGDRVQGASWPDELRRGRRWPWEGWWEGVDAI